MSNQLFMHSGDLPTPAPIAMLDSNTSPSSIFHVSFIFCRPCIVFYFLTHHLHMNLATLLAFLLNSRSISFLPFHLISFIKWKPSSERMGNTFHYIPILSLYLFLFFILSSSSSILHYKMCNKTVRLYMDTLDIPSGLV